MTDDIIKGEVEFYTLLHYSIRLGKQHCIDIQSRFHGSTMLKKALSRPNVDKDVLFAHTNCAIRSQKGYTLTNILQAPNSLVKIRYLMENKSDYEYLEYHGQFEKEPACG